MRPVTSTSAPFLSEYSLEDEVLAPERTLTSLAFITPSRSISVRLSELPLELLSPVTLT